VFVGLNAKCGLKSLQKFFFSGVHLFFAFALSGRLITFILSRIHGAMPHVFANALSGRQNSSGFSCHRAMPCAFDQRLSALAKQQ
jgi:hypothetical protein